MKLHLVTAAGFLVIAVLFGFAGSQGMFKGYFPDVRAVGCVPDAILVNPCRPWLGAAVGKYTQTSSGVRAQAEFHESQIGRKLDIVHTYHPPGSNALSADEVYLAKRSGTMLFANWKPATKWALAAGGDATTNAGIDKMANSVKALGGAKIFMTVHHEPENDVSGGATGCAAGIYKGTYGTTADYRNMWSNVRRRFSALGVTNVVWVMDYMNYAPWDCEVDDLYPGNNVVDWVMFNGYGDTSTVNYSTNVRHFYNLLTSINSSTLNFVSKPWGIVEWSVSRATAAQEYSYFDQAKASLEKNEFPKLKAYMVFDDVGPDGFENRISYVNPGAYDATKLAHYKAFANSAVFQGTTAPPPPIDTVPPAVSITAPANSALVASTTQVTATASDSVGVTKVDFLVDGNIVASDSSSPYSMAWITTQVANGSHTVTAKAYDLAGNFKTAAITVAVNNVTAQQAPRINSFTANPATTTVGGQSTLSWSTSATSSCTINPGGPQTTTAFSWTTPKFDSAGAHAYTLACLSAGGLTVQANATVNVTAPATPPSKPSLTADHTTVIKGSNVLISWSSSAASQCTLNPGNIVAIGSAGSKLMTNLQSTTSYSVTCTNTAGTSPANSITVNVASVGTPTKPSITNFSAVPASLSGPGITTLSWSSVNVANNGCSISGSPLTSASATGQWTTPQLNDSTTFTLTCKDYAGNLANQAVSVTVAGKAAPAPATGVPPAAPTTSSPVVTALDGKDIVNAQSTDKEKQGQQVTLDPSNIVDPAKISKILKIEYYDGEKLLQTVTSSPYGWNTTNVTPGTYSVTERVYYQDGSQSERTQEITVTPASAKSSRNSLGAVLGAIALTIFLIGGGGGALLFLTRQLWLGGLRQHWPWLDRYLTNRGSYPRPSSDIW